MLVPITELAAEFSLHPANLLLYLRGVGCPVHDAWQGVDEKWLDVIRAKYRDELQKSRYAPAVQRLDPARSVAEPLVRRELSLDALFILEKLDRNRKWGVAQVNIAGLQHLCHIPGDRVRSAVSELLRADLLSGEAKGPISLNPSRKVEIRNLADRIRSVHAARAGA